MWPTVVNGAVLCQESDHTCLSYGLTTLSVAVSQDCLNEYYILYNSYAGEYLDHICHMCHMRHMTLCPCLLITLSSPD